MVCLKEAFLLLELQLAIVEKRHFNSRNVRCCIYCQKRLKFRSQSQKLFLPVKCQQFEMELGHIKAARKKTVYFFPPG
jgi:hypothetical protein